MVFLVRRAIERVEDSARKVNMPEPFCEVFAKRLLIDSRCLTASELGSIILGIFPKDRKKRPKSTPGFIGRVCYNDPERRPHIPNATRAAVLSVSCCKACGSDGPLEVDHIQPHSKGGSSDLKNLQCLCLKCNRRKSNRT